MIRFDQVTKTYPGTARPALDGVSLEVVKGEFVFLVGASGSGKSSFLRLVLKEDRPTKGRIHVLGQDLGAIPNRKVPYFRRNLGVVFQDFRLLPGKTVFDNVAFGLARTPAQSRRARAQPLPLEHHRNDDAEAALRRIHARPLARTALVVEQHHDVGPDTANQWRLRLRRVACATIDA